MSLETADVASWHGMMTSVVAAGNGHLSDGFYRSIAPEAKVVLVKIGKTGHIPESNIEKGLRWVLTNKAVSDSHRQHFRRGRLRTNVSSQSAESASRRAVKAGMTVVCAVGNAGLAPGHPVLPPASAPSSIAVVDSTIRTHSIEHGAECIVPRMVQRSTVCKNRKIAPGIWVAGPILPHTPTADEVVFAPSSTLHLTKT